MSTYLNNLGCIMILHSAELSKRSQLNGLHDELTGIRPRGKRMDAFQELFFMADAIDFIGHLYTANPELLIHHAEKYFRAKRVVVVARGFLQLKGERKRKRKSEYGRLVSDWELVAFAQYLKRQQRPSHGYMTFRAWLLSLISRT